MGLKYTKILIHAKVNFRHRQQRQVCYSFPKRVYVFLAEPYSVGEIQHQLLIKDKNQQRVGIVTAGSA